MMFKYNFFWTFIMNLLIVVFLNAAAEVVQSITEEKWWVV